MLELASNEQRRSRAVAGYDFQLRYVIDLGAVSV